MLPPFDDDPLDLVRAFQEGLDDGIMPNDPVTNDDRIMECCKLLEHFSNLIDHWNGTSTSSSERVKCKNEIERMEGLVFSILSALDGCFNDISPYYTYAGKNFSLHEHWGEIRQKMKDKISDRQLFHALWTAAVGTEGYDKKMWQEAERRFLK
jgi:hypothetical protein